MTKQKALTALISLFVVLQTGTIFADEYVVRFDDSYEMTAFANDVNLLQTEIKDAIPQLHVVVVDIESSEKEKLQWLAKKAKYIHKVKKIALDPIKTHSRSQYDDSRTLWGMQAINAQLAWKFAQGENVIVAVSDTGVQWSHPDLKPNMWNNPGEIGKDAHGKDKSKNGIDDDGNGYIDDFMGWDFVSNKRAYLDNHYHGTHVAGTIAATQNGVGVVGAAPKAKIMISTFLGSQGSGTDLNGAKTIIYAADNGAKVVNCSWGGEGESPIIEDAIAYAAKKNVLIVAAAGNSSADTDKIKNIPSGSTQDNVIAIGATTSTKGHKAGFSNYGKTTVDLAAPGHRIFSTFNSNYGMHDRYRELSGTSMAAPHVSGVAALIYSVRPDFTWKQVKDVLMESTAAASDWTGLSVTGGVLKADKAVQLALTK